MDQLSTILSKLTSGLSFEPTDPLAHEKRKVDYFNQGEGKLEGYNCPRCRNKGLIAYWDEENRRMLVRPCRCRAIRQSLWELEQSGLKEPVKRFRFENFQAREPWQQHFLEAAKNYAADPRGRWFLAAGAPGSGKTHLCTAIARQLLLPPSSRSLRYLLWAEESRKLKGLLFDAAAYQEEMDRLKRCDVLYIDDFFKVKQGERVSTGDVNLAFELLSSRYNDPEKLTLISTEWYMEDLLALDEALASRIWERCKDGCVVSLRGEGKNWRMREG